jgi:chorismate-pyruvate lyase
VARTTAGRIPPPYHDLLVHENEMTSTLEEHFDGPLTVRVLSSFSKGRSYFRRVLLALERTGRPVAMGGVRLSLEGFNPAIRARILRERVPLGRILRDAGIVYGSRPSAFLRVTPNAEMMGIFWMAESQTLYGRQTFVTLGQARIGDIVEILPLV